MLNKAMIIGNLGADVDMQYTANGNAVSKFSVATSRKYQNGAGEQVEETEWFRVVAWNKLAEVCSQYLAKGKKVYVEGRMQTRSWEGQDGAKHYMTELVAQEVKFLSPSERGAAGGAEYDRPRAPEARQGALGDEDGDIEPDDLPF